METVLDSVIEFIRVRQLNVAVVALMTIMYLVYQYWGTLFRDKDDLSDDSAHSVHRMTRSRSRSRSRNRSGHHEYNKLDSKHGRGNRRGYGKCPDCSKCQLDG